VLRDRGTVTFYGYQLAKELKHAKAARLLTAYGTLYRALARLVAMGLLVARWEDAASANAEGRPPRRLYELTAQGHAARVPARSTVATSLVPRKSPSVA
jgi:DNA-binding PadR family transcriptional regulator